jgi:hypothetical protein
MPAASLAKEATGFSAATGIEQLADLVSKIAALAPAENAAR